MITFLSFLIVILIILAPYLNKKYYAWKKRDTTDRGRRQWEYEQEKQNNAVSILSSSAPARTTYITPKTRSTSSMLITSAASRRIPDDVKELLWFEDGELKNYKSIPIDAKSIDLGGGIILNVSFHIDEPSLISVKDPIRQGYPQKLGYYPTYDGLTPEQRYGYLSWLQDVDKPAPDIGYAFIFYYGLERFLLTPLVEKAFNMILRLRKSQQNKSFRYYSQNAILISILKGRKIDWLIRFSETLKKEDIEVSQIYLFTKYILKQPLFSYEIIKLSNKVEFKNKLYIKKVPEKFLKAIDDILIERYQSPILPICDYSLVQSKKTETTMYANVSINPRSINLPDLSTNLSFKNDIFNILFGAHERVKKQLQEERKLERQKQREAEKQRMLVAKNIEIKTKE